MEEKVVGSKDYEDKVERNSWPLNWKGQDFTEKHRIRSRNRLTFIVLEMRYKSAILFLFLWSFVSESIMLVSGRWVKYVFSSIILNFLKILKDIPGSYSQWLSMCETFRVSFGRNIEFNKQISHLLASF